MKGIYNKEALNRIAAQDRLDRMIVLVTPGAWISIIGAFIIVVALVVWGFFGTLPSSVDTSGMYINADGMGHMYSQAQGFVTDILIEENDYVEEGQLIVKLGTEDDIFKIRQIDNRIQYVENMTFDSELDEVTPDTEKMAQIKLNAKTADTSARKTTANLELKKEKLADAKALVEEKEEIMLDHKEKFFESLNITDQKEQLAYQEANSDYDKHYSLYEQYKTTYINAYEAYLTKKADFDGKFGYFDSSIATDDQLAAYDEAYANVMSAETQAQDAKYFMDEEEKRVKEANTSLDTARKRYLEYLNEVSGTAATNTIESTEYTEALQDYNTAKNQYKALCDEIDQLELQAVLDEGSAELDYESYEAQFDNEKSLTLHGLNAQRDELLNQADKNDIYSKTSGYVYDLLINIGSAVAVGTEIGQVMHGGTEYDEDIVVCYVKLSDAKKIKPGMEVHVSPSITAESEYGHILGTVEEVSNHVASNFDMLEQLGEQALVNEFTAAGAVHEVRVRLEDDGSSESGYRWSSQKGASVVMSTGTYVTATIITKNKRPIDVLIPYVKEKLEFKGEDNEK